MMNYFEYYPPKPELRKKNTKGHLSKTIFSMVLFALTFSILINDYFLIGSLLLVLLIHELGHFLTMKRFGYHNLKMLFIPFLGALVQGEKEKYSQKESSLMIMAGPLPGMIFGFLALHFGVGYEINWLIQLGVLFIFLNLFNLIPIEPLDGGQLMRVLFLQNNDFVQLLFTFFSSLLLIGLGWWLQAWVIVGFGFIIGLRVKNMYKLYQIRKELQSADIPYVSTYENLSDRTFAKIKEIVFEYTPVLKDIEHESEESKFNQIIANQVDHVLIRPISNDTNAFFKLVMVIVWLLAFGYTFYLLFSFDLNAIIHAFQNR